MTASAPSAHHCVNCAQHEKRVPATQTVRYRDRSYPVCGEHADYHRRLAAMKPMYHVFRRAAKVMPEFETLTPQPA